MNCNHFVKLGFKFIKYSPSMTLICQCHCLLSAVWSGLVPSCVGLTGSIATTTGHLLQKMRVQIRISNRPFFERGQGEICSVPNHWWGWLRYRVVCWINDNRLYKFITCCRNFVFMSLYLITSLWFLSFRFSFRNSKMLHRSRLTFQFLDLAIFSLY